MSSGYYTDHGAAFGGFFVQGPTDDRTALVSVFSNHFSKKTGLMFGAKRSLKGALTSDYLGPKERTDLVLGVMSTLRADTQIQTFRQLSDCCETKKEESFAELGFTDGEKRFINERWGTVTGAMSTSEAQLLAPYVNPDTPVDAQPDV